MENNDEIRRVVSWQRRRKFILISFGIFLYFYFVMTWLWDNICDPSEYSSNGEYIFAKIGVLIITHLLAFLVLIILYITAMELPTWVRKKFKLFKSWWNGY